jgi:plastocyanin domain-containing protein
MKKIIISAVVSVGLLFGFFMLGYGAAPEPSNTSDVVTVENGTQIITITAKGGYRPRSINAAANMPTIFRVVTDNTFDCSSALVIPQLGYRKSLPPVGETMIPVAAQKAGASIQGLCTMGMYQFTVNFM